MKKSIDPYEPMLLYYTYIVTLANSLKYQQSINSASLEQLADLHP